MSGYTRRTGFGFLRLPHAQRLEEEIAATIAGDRTMMSERPTLQRGESLEDFDVRQRAWFATWSIEDALDFLDENVTEGPQDAKAAELIRAEVESLRAAVERVRDEATKMLAKTDLSGGAYHEAAQMFLRAVDGET